MRELIDHIRTVHFALVITSCVLIATAVSRSNRSLDQAIRDARAIARQSTPEGRTAIAQAMAEQAERVFGRVRRLEPASPRRTQWLNMGIRVAPGAQFLGPSDADWQGLTEYEPWVADSDTPPRLFASPYPGWFYLQRLSDEGPEPVDNPRVVETPNGEAYEGGHDVPVAIAAWDTLGAFRDYWDGLPTLVAIPKVAADGWEGSLECDDGKARRFVFSGPQPATEKLRYRTTWDSKRRNLAVDTVLVYDYGISGHTCHVSKNEVPFLDAREALVRTLRKSSTNAAEDVLVRPEWAVPFASAFTDLDSHTTNLKNMAFSDLLAELVRRSDENEGAIQLFGAAFPSDVIASVGTTVVLGCLLYLLMHLNELRGDVVRWSDRPPTGYVGLYRHWLPRVVTASTMTILPATAVYFVLTQSQHAMPSYGVVVVVGAAATIGGLCVARLDQVARLLALRRRENLSPTADDLGTAGASKT